MAKPQQTPNSSPRNNDQQRHQRRPDSRPPLVFTPSGVTLDAYFRHFSRLLRTMTARHGTGELLNAVNDQELSVDEQLRRQTMPDLSLLAQAMREAVVRVSGAVTDDSLLEHWLRELQSPIPRQPRRERPTREAAPTNVPPLLPVDDLPNLQPLTGDAGAPPVPDFDPVPVDSQPALLESDQPSDGPDDDDD